VNYGGPAAAFTGTGANGSGVNTIPRTSQGKFPSKRDAPRLTCFRLDRYDLVFLGQEFGGVLDQQPRSADGQGRPSAGESFSYEHDTG
jgi:hypothetical protein